MYKISIFQVDTLRNSVRNVGNLVRAMPENIVSKVSGGIKNTASFVFDDVGKVLNQRGVSFFCILRIIC